jgi:hypothetical protein
MTGAAEQQVPGRVEDGRGERERDGGSGHRSIILA